MNKILKIVSVVLLLVTMLSDYEVKAQDLELPQEQVSQSYRKEKVIDKAGTYFFALSIDDDEHEETEYTRVHIRYPKTVLNKAKDEGIDAHDIVVLTGTFETMNKSDLMRSGASHAWSMIDGEPTEKISVDIEEPIPLTGTVGRIIYKTDNDTKVEVNVFEQDYIYFIPDELYMNQYPILNDRFRTLSALIIFIVILPILLFILLFRYMHKKTKSMIDLLERR